MDKLIIRNMPELSYSTEEAMNRLRVNMNFLGNDTRKIMIISSTENEGKTFVAMHLWRQMAQAGTHSVLVDMDLRKSVMVRDYQIEPEGGGELKGTTHVLADKLPLEEGVFHTEMEQGDILPNAKNLINPTMLLEEAYLRELLDQMARDYRYVFVDAPPLNMVSDGEKIGSLCDGAIVVVRGGKTSRKMLKNSIRLLERDAPLIGVVVNRVEDSKNGYYYKTYKQVK